MLNSLCEFLWSSHKSYFVIETDYENPRSIIFAEARIRRDQGQTEHITENGHPYDQAGS